MIDLAKDHYFCPGCGAAINKEDERPRDTDVPVSYRFFVSCPGCRGRFEVIDRLVSRGRYSEDKPWPHP